MLRKGMTEKESENRYSELFETFSLAIFQTKLDGKIITVNPECARMFGYTSPQELIAAIKYTANAYADPKQRDEISRLIAESPGQDSFEILFRRKDGSTFLGKMTVRKIKDPDGNISTFNGFIEDITEHKWAEAALRESEERFLRLSTLTSEGIGISDQGRIVDANPQLATLLGYEPGELIGMDTNDVVAPESHDLVMANQRAGFEGPYEHLAIKKDGTIFPVEIRARTIPYKGHDARVAIIRDLMERKQAEAALLARETHFRALIENSTDAIVLVDSEWIILYTSPSHERTTGYRPDQRLGHSVFDVIHPDDFGIALQHLTSLLELPDQVNLPPIRSRHADGSWRWIEAVARNLLTNRAYKL